MNFLLINSLHKFSSRSKFPQSRVNITTTSVEVDVLFQLNPLFEPKRMFASQTNADKTCTSEHQGMTSKLSIEFFVHLLQNLSLVLVYCFHETSKNHKFLYPLKDKSNMHYDFTYVTTLCTLRHPLFCSPQSQSINYHHLMEKVILPMGHSSYFNVTICPLTDISHNKYNLFLTCMISFIICCHHKIMKS